MGELLARHLHRFGLTEFILVGEAANLEEHLAQQLGGRIVPMDGLAEALTQADILVSSLGTRGSLITSETAEAALKQRKQRQILLFDAAIPGDIERAVGELEGAFLYDLNDLENLVMEGRMESNTALEAAWEIVESGLMSYVRGEDDAREIPVIGVLRQRLEILRGDVLAQPQGANAGSATALFMEKILKDLSGQLHAENSERSAGSMEATLRRLFGLTGGKDR
jgi:glutamyl-tRNA reductase